MTLRKASHKVSFAHCPVHASCAPAPPKNQSRVCIAPTFHHTQKTSNSQFITRICLYMFTKTQTNWEKNPYCRHSHQIQCRPIRASSTSTGCPFRPLARGHAARPMVELDMDSEDDDTTEADSNEMQTFEENDMHFG